MPYTPIEIDRENLTIMGVKFPDLETLDSSANAIGSNMFEGFEPTPGLITIYRDYRAGMIPAANLVEILKQII
jgi:putative transcriptional regulator